MARFAKLAVDIPRQHLDVVYDYAVPEALEATCKPGCRVLVPYGKGNRRVEGFVLSLCEQSTVEGVKPIESVVDAEPLLTKADVQLALWVRERFFCTCYAALKAMLPSGLWLKGQEYAVAQPFDEQHAALLSDEAVALWQWLCKQKTAVLRAKWNKKEPAGTARQALEQAGIVAFEARHAPRIGDKQELLVSLAEGYEPDGDVRKQKTAPLQTALLQFLVDNGPTVTWSELRYYTGATPPALRALEKSGAVTLVTRQAYRRPDVTAADRRIETLTPAQQVAFDALAEALHRPDTAGALLHGVTGSGKTAVYIKLIERVLAEGGGALVLVPEIALTPQLMAQFMAQFGKRVAVLHSALSLAQRYDEWKLIRSGQADVVVGTRSAVFAPVRNLSLVIVDEEHENSFKSENAPRYHARDVAKYRCRQHNALLVLGSATPSVETMYAARQGDIALVTLPGRFNESALPPVVIADVREDLEQGHSGAIGLLLRQELEQNLERGEQAILFVNRRGRDRMQCCVSCGYIPECQACSSQLVYHAANRRLMCHYCQRSLPVPPVCPHCGGVLKPYGFGTQKVAEELQALFPDVPLLRMDSDTTAGKGAHEALLNRFRDEKVPFLVGTQMVAKGLDFENVTLVGVLAADSALNANDYRAHERAFALMTQVIGRAGRAAKPGRAVIQTFQPHNAVLAASAAQDYDAFYAAEIALRRARRLPPFSQLLALTLSGLLQDEVAAAADELKVQLAALGDGVQVLGPTPAALFRLNYRYRYQILLCGQFDRAQRSCLTALLADLARKRRTVSAYADFEPNQT